jgi:hypothetical protein
MQHIIRNLEFANRTCISHQTGKGTIQIPPTLHMSIVNILFWQTQNFESIVE